MLSQITRSRRVYEEPIIVDACVRFCSDQGVEEVPPDSCGAAAGPFIWSSDGQATLLEILGEVVSKHAVAIGWHLRTMMSKVASLQCLGTQPCEEEMWLNIVPGMASYSIRATFPLKACIRVVYWAHKATYPHKKRRRPHWSELLLARHSQDNSLSPALTLSPNYSPDNELQREVEVRLPMTGQMHASAAIGRVPGELRASSGARCSPQRENQQTTSSFVPQTPEEDIAVFDDDTLLISLDIDSSQTSIAELEERGYRCPNVQNINLKLYDWDLLDTLLDKQIFRNLISMSLQLSEDISDISPLHRLSSKLVGLFISDCHGIENLINLGLCPWLARMNMRDLPQVTDLSPLSLCCGLKYLDISRCTSLVDLSPLQACQGLLSIFMAGCLGIQDLSPLAACTSLTELHVEDCPSVTCDCLDDVQRALPYLAISR